jgi:hypothetical protein
MAGLAGTSCSAARGRTRSPLTRPSAPTGSATSPRGEDLLDLSGLGFESFSDIEGLIAYGEDSASITTSEGTIVLQNFTGQLGTSDFIF